MAKLGQQTVMSGQVRIEDTPDSAHDSFAAANRAQTPAMLGQQSTIISILDSSIYGPFFKSFPEGFIPYDATFFTFVSESDSQNFQHLCYDRHDDGAWHEPCDDGPDALPECARSPGRQSHDLP